MNSYNMQITQRCWAVRAAHEKYIKHASALYTVMGKNFMEILKYSKNTRKITRETNLKSL